MFIGSLTFNNYIVLAMLEFDSVINIKMWALLVGNCDLTSVSFCASDLMQLEVERSKRPMSSKRRRTWVRPITNRTSVD